MTNNPTERHIGSQTMKKLPEIILYAGKIFIAVTTFILFGCHGNPNTEAQEYHSPSDVLKDYSSCLEKLKSIDKADSKELVELVKEWKVLDDTIASRFFRESYGTDANHTDTSYLCIRDSIVIRLGELAVSENRTFTDYIGLVTSVNKQPSDPTTAELMMSMHRFFGAMDGTATYGANAKSTIAKYETMLDNALTSGFVSKQAVFDYLKDEDMAFRSFLVHLSSLGNIPLTKVRDNSAETLKRIIGLASEENGLFQPTELVTILTMRNNRRLLQNALQCINDIRTGKIGKDDRAPAYMWMMLQPWISFDTLSFSLMSAAQLNTLGILATETPKCLEILGNPDFPIDIEELPALLSGTFISTL